MDARTAKAASELIETDIPARLDRLTWCRFHTLVVIALGVTWVLDGLEVTLAGAVSGALKESPRLHFSNTDVGFASSAYLAGAVLGALGFGWLTDRLGRKRLFFITLAVYLVSTAATAFSWSVMSFALFRFLTGAGIGGEYTAINSTIQEVVPARYRGWTDLVINGSFWVGAAVGAAGSIVLLDPAVLPADIGWRCAFLIGAALGLVIFIMRFWIPESPRWLMTHGRLDEAAAIVTQIEEDFRASGHRLAPGPLPPIRLRTRRFTPLREVFRTLFRVHRQRTLVGLALMTAQAFFYNAIFFTNALVLADFYGVRPDHVGWYLLPFAAGNFLGPVLLGRLFDTDWAAADDHGDLCAVRPASCRFGLSVRHRRAIGPGANDRLDGDFLRRFGRGELGLSHRQRDIPARSPRARHRVLLCDRHRYRRCFRPLAVRRADRHRIALEPVRRLRARGGADARRRARRLEVWRGGGTEAA